MKRVNTGIIEDYMKKNDMTMTAFCKFCHITTTTFKKVMANEMLTHVPLFKISVATNIPIEFLFKTIRKPKEEKKDSADNPAEK